MRVLDRYTHVDHVCASHLLLSGVKNVHSVADSVEWILKVGNSLLFCYCKVCFFPDIPALLHCRLLLEPRLLNDCYSIEYQCI